MAETEDRTLHDELEGYRHDRFLPAEIHATRPVGHSGRFGAVAGAHYVDDLQNPDDTDRDDFLLSRLPTAQAHALPAPLPFPFAEYFVPAFDVQYAWYQQRDLPQECELVLVSDGILELMPVEDMVKRYSTLLSARQGAALDLDEMTVGLDVLADKHLPDDIAFLVISRNHADG